MAADLHPEIPRRRSERHNRITTMNCGVPAAAHGRSSAVKPQIVAIHQEAMQKAKTVMDSTLSQMRPLLNPDQQTKLDAIQKAHQDMMNAHKELHDAMQE